MNKRVRNQHTYELVSTMVIVMLISLTFTVLWANMFKSEIIFFKNGYIIIGLIYAVIYSVFCIVYKGDKVGSTRINELIYSNVLSLLFTNVITYFQLSLLIKRLFDASGFLVITLIQIVLIIILVIVSSKVYHTVIKPLKIVLIYQGDCAKLVNKIEKYQSDNFQIVNKVEYTDRINIEHIIKQYEGVMIYNLTESNREKVVLECYRNTITVFNIPNAYSVILSNARSIHMIDTPVMSVNNFGPSQIDKIIKRVIDLVICVPAFIITLPVWVVVYICIKLEDRGPLFYKQVRLTQYGEKFEIIKFRSMRVDAEKNSGAQLAKQNDNRITKTGNIIRKLRIDELPQLLNIIKGDMSIVGPRPERPELMEKIVKDYPDFTLRLKVKAGLTGYAQVYGKYNTTFEDKALMDLMYIENYSLLLDLKLMFMTVKILFMKESTEGVE